VTEAITPLDIDASDADELHCYRHPDRETRVRCGRCDRPICTRCAMQGPVGFRCRDCGKPAYDPLHSLSGVQAAKALGISLTIGIGVGAVGVLLGLFSLLLGFFGGGLAAETVSKAIGLKHGIPITLLVFGGLICGVVIGQLAGWAFLGANVVGASATATFAALATNPEAWYGFLAPAILPSVAACVGAWTRMR
jgi:hypothetical protein